MNTIISQLKSHLQSNELHHFFDEIEAHLVPDSDLSDLVLLLHNRHQRLRMASIRGTISDQKKQQDHNQLVQDLLEILHMADEGDFIAAEVEQSIAWFQGFIAAKQKELEKGSNQKADGVEKAGESLVKLGQLLSGKKEELDPKIPFPKLLQSAAQKALRRVNIACKELKELRSFQNKTFRELTDLYDALVKYLDLPNETLDAPKITILQQLLADAKRYSDNMTSAKGTMTNYMTQSSDQISKFLAVESFILQKLDEADEDTVEVKTSIDFTFRKFEEMQAIYQEATVFFIADDMEMDQLIGRLNGLVGELELNVKEY